MGANFICLRVNRHRSTFVASYVTGVYGVTLR
jgi:hypothetical protein